ncbi:unnamed protein product [Prunus armeniaca]|uniref:Pentacotripeptide-repeat region of PRORP domain-containing protein n=1 Tax=Prunus armeniaca TaxID=36596 RepID=A0A6J5TYS4_PRUAR|nr:unnamed protein product [Prunus armeniaca]
MRASISSWVNRRHFKEDDGNNSEASFIPITIVQVSAMETLYKLWSFFNYTGNRRGFYHSSFSLDTMLYILGRSRMFDKTWEVLVDIKYKDRNLITPRTVMIVLARIAKVCSVRQTVESFRKFKKLVPEFDTTCFNSLLRTLCQEKSMTDARNVYHSLKHNFTPNLQTFNILLSGWKSSEEAEGFFKEMREMGVEPDIPDKARDVLKEMKEFGCYPDVAAYNAAIRNFCIAKRLGDAYGLMDAMMSKGLSPNATTYNLFFRVFFWSNDVQSSWGLYGRMMHTGCLPNTQSCMFLIRLFKRQEKVDMALQLWNDMVEKGFGSYILVSDVLFDLLCDLGKLMEAERCFLQMMEKGHKPSNVSFRRIKVLMELANKHEALNNLTEKIAVFGSSIHLPGSTKSSAETSRLESLPI